MARGRRFVVIAELTKRFVTECWFSLLIMAVPIIFSLIRGNQKEAFRPRPFVNIAAVGCSSGNLSFSFYFLLE